MKKIFGLMTGIGIIFGSGNVFAATSEYTCPEGSVSTLHCFTCGEHCTMTLDTSTGHAVVSGTGDMDTNRGDGTRNNTNAWKKYQSLFKSIEIQSGITSIGHGAFRGTSVETVTIPNTVNKIGTSAFFAAGQLQNIAIPNSVTIIEGWAFGATPSLTEFIIPDSVTTIGSGLFGSGTYDANASGIKKLTIPDTLLLKVLCTGSASCSKIDNTFSQNSLQTVYCSGGGDTTKCDAILKQGGKNIHSISKPSPKKVGKRIYTVEEATKAVSGKGRNKFIIRYR